MRAPFVLVGLLLLALGLSGCGQSKSEKAQKKVCDARADISKQVNELKALTPTTATVAGVRANVSAIQDGLKTIVGAQDTLSGDRRKNVKAATEAFVASIASIAKGLTTNLSLSQARSQAAQAAQDLRAAYASSLGRISCS